MRNKAENLYSGDESLLSTKVFAKAGLDNVTSTKCKHQQLFGLDVQCSALVLNFNNIFSDGHLLRVGKSMNSLISQILKPLRQLY
jgi:hypothetical protein